MHIPRYQYPSLLILLSISAFLGLSLSGFLSVRLLVSSLSLSLSLSLSHVFLPRSCLLAITNRSYLFHAMPTHKSFISLLNGNHQVSRIGTFHNCHRREGRPAHDKAFCLVKCGWAVDLR